VSFDLCTLPGAINAGDTDQVCATADSLSQHKPTRRFYNTSADSLVRSAGARARKSYDGSDGNCCANHYTHANQDYSGATLFRWGNRGSDGPCGGNPIYRLSRSRGSAHGPRDAILRLIRAGLHGAGLWTRRLSRRGLGLILRRSDW
jgi:hypothetical protein